jgi:hypothetical protein
MFIAKFGPCFSIEQPARDRCQTIANRQLRLCYSTKIGGRGGPPVDIGYTVIVEAGFTEMPKFDRSQNGPVWNVFERKHVSFALRFDGGFALLLQRRE